jgi:beta-1,4-N-acetylglucosaminyltransferase
MKLFVTVGTTKFDELIQFVSSDLFLDSIWNSGYEYLTVQHGTSQFVGYHSKLQINSFDYAPSLSSYYSEADTIISSGGSGTILEVLALQKTMIVCVNNTLQDNHQIELSHKLSIDGYLVLSKIEELHLAVSATYSPKPWTPVRNAIVTTIIDQYMH